MAKSLREKKKSASKVFCKRGKNRLLFPPKDEIIITGLRSEFRHFSMQAEHDVGVYLVCKWRWGWSQEGRAAERDACCRPWRLPSFSTAESSLRWESRPCAAFSRAQRRKRALVISCSPPSDGTPVEQRGLLPALHTRPALPTLPPPFFLVWAILLMQKWRRCN